jgi:Fungal specific transcription factor domain
MSAARKDPFASLPITLDHEGHELMDTYVTVVPGLVFRSDLHTTYLLNPIRDVLFKEALSSPLLFRATVLSFTAGYRARWYGFTETEQSRRFRNRALQEAEDSARQLHDGSKPTNGFIMGITSLAHWEDRWGSLELAYKHLTVAQSLIADHYDMTSPRPREPCETWLHWVRVTMGPVPDTDQRTFPSLRSCLRDFSQLHLAHHSFAPRFHNMRRFRMFGPGTTVYKNLAVCLKVDSVPEEQYVYSVMHRMNRMIRLACLIYIHFALWDYRESLEDMEEYLATLERIGIQHDLDRYPSAPILLWAMLDGEDHPRLGDPARGWKVGDVLNQVKKLPFDYQEGLGDFLFALLSREIPFSPASLQRWESNLETR